MRGVVVVGLLLLIRLNLTCTYRYIIILAIDCFLIFSSTDLWSHASYSIDIIILGINARLVCDIKF